jgi:hypothetical protein
MLPDVLFFGIVFTGLSALAATVVLVVSLVRGQQRRASEHGYPSTFAYLRAAPRTDAEKQDAADLALKGLVICLLGLILPLLLLIGLFPLFYGARKLVYASMGLGLVDDGGEPPRPLRGA